MRRRRHHSHSDSPGLLGQLIKLVLVLVLLVGVGGFTWLVLTPLDAPSQPVVREVSLDRPAQP